MVLRGLRAESLRFKASDLGFRYMLCFLQAICRAQLHFKVGGVNTIIYLVMQQPPEMQSCSLS